MAKNDPRTVFDRLLAKTHVQHALIQPDGRHNEFPSVSQDATLAAVPRLTSQALATLFLLDGMPDRLQATYDGMKGDLSPWEPSPRSIPDEDTRSRFLGDARHERPLIPPLPLSNSLPDSNAPS